jgi:hypothetical protein
MTIITTLVPEHSLRHDLPRAATNSTADADAGSGRAGASAGKPGRPGGRNGAFRESAGTKSAVRACPFVPNDAPPLAWWRMLPPDLLRDAEHLQVRSTLNGITVLHGGDDFAAALRGDPATAIAEAFSLMPICEVTLEVDIAMTALLRCAIEPNASAALVLAQILGLTELGHAFAMELAASWFSHGLRYSADPRKFREAETVLEAAFRERLRGGGGA